MNGLLNYYCAHIPIIFIFIAMYYRYKKYDFKKLDRRTNKKDSFVIRYSELYGHIGLFGICSFLIMFTIIELLGPEPFFNNDIIDWVFPLFSYMGVLIVYGTSMKKVVVKKDLVTVYPSIGKPYSFTFGDIVYVRRRVKPNRNRTEWITVKTSARRKLEVDSMSYGYNRYYDKILELTVPQIRKGFLEDKVTDVEVPPDVVAFFEFNGERETPVHSGYRPGHLVTDDYVTTGVHRYFETDVVPPDGIATGTITFITPDLYPNCLWKGKKIQIMEGARIVGYATIRQVLNPILDKDQHL